MRQFTLKFDAGCQGKELSKIVFYYRITSDFTNSFGIQPNISEIIIF